MKTQHTPGAMKAATVIMNGKNRIKTNYGEKSLEGIADLIDRETAAPELLEACEQALELIKIARGYFPKSVHNQDKFQLESACAAIGTAIQKAGGAE